MQCLLASALVACSLLLPSLSPGQPEPSLAKETSLVPFAARRVAVGMTRPELKWAAGAPDVALDANVWIYWDFRVREVSADKNHDALLVVFEGDRVKFFKFTASAPVRAFIAQQAAKAKNSPVASK
jgi:hypothetical protein